MCVMREKKKQAEAVEKHIKEFNLSKIYDQQSRKVEYSRARNEMLQRAGESALLQSREESRRKEQERDILRQDELLAGESTLCRRTVEREVERAARQRPSGAGDGHGIIPDRRPVSGRRGV